MSPRSVVGQLARGFAMGSADVVPGVSGGTVALVLGIYTRLIDNVHAGARALGQLARRNLLGFLLALRRVEWVWLLSLLCGILLAVVTLASAIEHLLEEQPVRMAGLFFGLILGSVVVSRRLVRRVDRTGVLLCVAVAAVVSLALGLRSETAGTGAEVVAAPWWAFLAAGALAICAMVLPGVSGSFILVMIGMYGDVLGAVSQRDLVALALFALGCVAGLSAFSTLLNWLLHQHHDRVLAVMVGLMLGSLRVLWPWPGGVTSTRVGAPTGDVAGPVLLALVGLVAVLAIEAFGTRRQPVAAGRRA